MSVDTMVNLRGKIEFEDILNFIKNNYDKEAKIVNRNHVIMDYVNLDDAGAVYDTVPYYEHGCIVFLKNDRLRTMHMYYSSVNFYENLDYHTQYGNEAMVISETTHLSLGHDDDAIEVLTNIVKAYGGWIDYNDCDDEDYVYFDRGADVPKKVRHVTREEIYKMFGEVVIIDD